MILDRTLKALKYIVAKDNNRPVLSGILFDENIAMGTDGFKLMIMRLPNQESQTLQNKLILNMKSVVNAVKRLGKAPYDSLSATEDPIEGDTINIKGLDKDGSGFVEVAKKIEGTYPNHASMITNAIQKDGKSVTYIGVNNMLEAFQALKNAGVDNVLIKITDEIDPIYMVGKNVNGRVEILLMPVRIEEAEKAELLNS